MIQFFDSLQEFEKSVGTHEFRAASYFNDHQSLADVRKNLYKGKPQSVERSSKLLDEMEYSIETSTRVFERGLVGFMPCVPSYLAGAPDAMYHESHVQADTSPVRIFASICVSADLSPRELESRGVTILALARKLQASRPVELYIYADMNASAAYDYAAIPGIKIETNPLDLTSVSYAMSDVGFLRQLCFCWGKKYGFTGGWAYNTSPNDSKIQACLKKDLGMSDEDLLIPGGYATDPLVRTPTLWLAAQILKYKQTEIEM